MMEAFEGYLEGPRWRLPAGTIQKFLIDSHLRRVITLEYERRETSFMGATIFYRVSGERENIQLFKRILSEAVDYNNFGV